MVDNQNDIGSPPAVKDTGGRWVPNWMTLGEAVDPTKKPVISDAEVFALLEYAANHGIEKEKLGALSREIHVPEPNPSAVASLYADLVSATAPISGRTLIDSTQSSGKRLWVIAIATGAFFILAIGNQIVESYVADIVKPEEGLIWLNVNWLDVKRYVWDYLSPFFWGALGSCVYLLKALQDAVRKNIYEQHLMHGWRTRILIGGILAAIVLILFDPTNLSATSLPLRPAAIAFLIGLGVRPVYGALEKTIDTLSEKLGLESIRTVPIAKVPELEPREPKGDDGV